MNPKRKAFLEQQRLREEQMRRRAAEQSAAPAVSTDDIGQHRTPRRVEVIDRPVHDGLGGKFESGAVVTETADNSRAINAWLERGWARITS